MTHITVTAFSDMSSALIEAGAKLFLMEPESDGRIKYSFAFITHQPSFAEAKLEVLDRTKKKGILITRLPDGELRASKYAKPGAKPRPYVQAVATTAVSDPHTTSPINGSGHAAVSRSASAMGGNSSADSSSISLSPINNTNNNSYEPPQARPSCPSSAINLTMN